MKYNDEPYLRSEDLLFDGVYKKIAVKIEAVLTEAKLNRKNKSYSGLALRFADKEKVLGLGLTNESLIKAITGDARPEKWLGHTINLEVREVRSANGGTEPAIRIMPEKGTRLRSGLIRQLGSEWK